MTNIGKNSTNIFKDPNKPYRALTLYDENNLRILYFHGGKLICVLIMT